VDHAGHEIGESDDQNDLQGDQEEVDEGFHVGRIWLGRGSTGVP